MYSIKTTSYRYDGAITVDGDAFEGPRMFDPVVTLEKNRGGSFEFTVYDDHTLYNDFKLFVDRIHVVNNGRHIFSGRGVQESFDFYNRRKVTCEGVLAFLSDVIIPYSTAYTSPTEYLKYIIDSYNNAKNKDTSQSSYNRFTLVSYPTVGLKNTKDLTSNADKYKTAFDLFTELLEYCEWLVEIDYTNYRDDSYGLIIKTKEDYTHPTPIIFGENLKDISRSNNMAEFATIFYPLGRPKNSSSEGSDIESHRGGSIISGKTFSTRKYINSSGTVTTESSTSSQKIIYMDEWLDQVEKVIISTTVSSGYSYYSFLDGSGNPLDYQVSDGSIGVNLEVEVPNGASRLCVAYYGTNFNAHVYSYVSYGDHKGVELSDSDLLLVTSYAYITDEGYVIEEDPNGQYNMVVTFDSTHLIAGNKLIITTKARNGHGLYSFVDNYDHVLDLRSSNNSPVVTFLDDEVVTIPEGAKKLYLGYYDSSGINDANVWLYINDTDDNALTHLGSDLLVTQSKTIGTVFGHLDGTDGRIINYQQTYVVGARTDSIVYTGLKVKSGKKYVYSGMQRDSHGMIRVRGASANESYYLKTANSGSVPTNLQYFEFTVPSGGTTIDLGGILGDAKTHLWEYNEDTETKDNYITIESVNDGYPYLKNDSLIAQYGWIERVKTFDDIDSPSMLLKKAQEFFNKQQKNKIEYTVKAVDPAVTSDEATYLPLDKVVVKSTPHGVNVTMTVNRAEIHLDSPGSNTYEFTYEE